MVRTQTLTKRYPGGERPPAVDRLDLDIRPGEIFGLLGPNGAGKTTTIGMLTTGVVPTSGTAFIAGVDVTKRPTTVRQVIGVVSQANTPRPLAQRLQEPVPPRPLLRPVRRRGEFGGRTLPGAVPSGRPAQRSRRHPLGRHGPASDGGPSGHASPGRPVPRRARHRTRPQSRLDLWDLLRALNASGQTVLLTTHNMDEADQLCRRVATMDHGRILALGTPAALKSSVDADTVVAVVARAPIERMEAAFDSVNGVVRAE